MLDIKLIRECPEKINELLKRRNPELSIDEVLKIDEERRKIQTQADELRAKRKNDSQKIGMMKKNGENTDAIQEEVRKLGDDIKALEEKQTELDNKQRDILLHTPNIPDETTPIGLSEDDNVEVYKWGEPRKFDFEFKAHWDLCEEKGLVDFERGVKISQSRFILYRGKGAKLERAIINFFLDYHTQEQGYEEILPPFMANAATMTGTGQLPKFKEDMYKCVDEDLYLIPTAEVPVTNIYSGEILSEDDLPKYMTAYTPCFRRESGSAGKDTRGLITGILAVLISMELVITEYCLLVIITFLKDVYLKQTEIQVFSFQGMIQLLQLKIYGHLTILLLIVQHLITVIFLSREVQERMQMDLQQSLHVAREMCLMDVYHTAILMMDGIYMPRQLQDQQVS